MNLEFNEALYLSDPDGHGIEIYRERPNTEWPHREGKLWMAFNPSQDPSQNQIELKVA